MLKITLDDVSIAHDSSVYQKGKGTIVDSGTTDTYLPRSVATGFSKAWQASTGKVRRLFLATYRAPGPCKACAGFGSVSGLGSLLQADDCYVLCERCVLYFIFSFPSSLLCDEQKLPWLLYQCFSLNDMGGLSLSIRSLVSRLS